MKSTKVPRAEKLLRVGLYDLEKTLGKGNFAIVKLGVHRLTKTNVAVKIVNKIELDDDNLNKISREIDIMRRLSHKNIIKLYQVMESDTFIYIITEFAANGEIFDWLVTNKKMSEHQAQPFFSFTKLGAPPPPAGATRPEACPSHDQTFGSSYLPNIRHPS